MTTSSSCSSRVSKLELRSRQVWVKRPKIDRGKKERNSDFIREDISSGLDRQMVQDSEILDDIPDIAPNGSAAAKLEMLYQYENRENQLESDDQSISGTSDQMQGDDRNRSDEANDNRSGEADGDTNDEAVGNRNDEADDNRNAVAALRYYRRKEKKREQTELKRYMTLKKGFRAAMERINKLSSEWKTVKSAMQRRGPQRDTDDEDDEDFDLLPRFPLKKFKEVILMQSNSKNRVCKAQFIAKLRSIGGSTIKKNVINIFKILFSSKLKTQICWKGSARGKKSFQQFDQILSVLRQAVKYRFKKCSADDIATECKLRFKQAEKDFQRQLLKNQLLNQ